MKHKDHEGNVLSNEEANVYWRGYIAGRDVEINKRGIIFRDMTGFEKFLVSMGWELEDFEYPTDYFTSYGTTVRSYKKASNRISVGLTNKGIKVLYPLIKLKKGDKVYHVNSELPLPGEYEKGLNRLLE